MHALELTLGRFVHYSDHRFLEDITVDSTSTDGNRACYTLALGS